MPDRIVRLGIDYGTSFSKIVFRDYGAPGGEKAYVMVRNGDFRTPSAVGVSGSDFIFGHSPNSRNEMKEIVWHESVKMRVAGEIKRDYARYYFGPLRELPEGFSARDLAVLTVWFLISEGRKAVRDHLVEHSVWRKIFSRSSEVRVGFSLGIPMSFYDDVRLKNTFLEIARTAWEISNGLSATSRISFKDARKALDFGYQSVKEKGEVPKDSIRNWIRTEAEAALWWPFQSPGVSEGPYAQIDMGAGTTNLSIFRIVPKHTNSGWIKESLSFFGAVSPPVGMDAVDQALVKWQASMTENVLSLRGREKELLQTRSGEKIVSEVVRQLRESYRSIIERASAKHRWTQTERERWKQHKIFFLGGGSQIEAIRRPLTGSPIRGNENRNHDIASLDKPADLLMSDKRRVTVDLLPHIAVAYGLSNLADEIPKAESPGEVPPMQEVSLRPRRSRRLLDVDEWRY